MRKLKLFLLLVSFAGILGACSKTDTPPGGSPIAVTLTPSTANANPGDSVVINCTITDQNTLKDVVITETLPGGSPSQLQSYSLSGKSYQFSYTYHVPAVSAGNIVVTFTVDDASNTQTATTTITVGATGKDYNSFSAVLLGSYADPNVGSFYGSSNNEVFNVTSANQNQGLVDMVFFYGASNQYTLAAPSDASFSNGSPGQITSLGIQNWTTRNATNFRTTTLTDFSSITKGADIATAYSAGSNTNSKANLLTAGQIIAFQTQAGKYGLCKIVDVTGGNTSGLGEMHIQVVDQQ
jgi:hypothetical protein